MKHASFLSGTRYLMWALGASTILAGSSVALAQAPMAPPAKSGTAVTQSPAADKKDSAMAPMQGMGSDMRSAMMGSMNSMESMKMTGDTDRDFAIMMKAHHQGAIDMAQLELKSGKDGKMRAMAKRIIDAQQKEIKELDQWLATRK